MHFTDKLKQQLHAAAQQMHDAAEKLLPASVSDEIQAARLAICRSCDYLFKPTMQCKKCGCFLLVKTALAPYECPLKKWTAVIVDVTDQTK